MKWNRNKVLVAASMAIGLLFGLLRPQFLTEQAHADLVTSLQHFAASLNAQNPGVAALFEGILRYGRTLLLIWACATLPKSHYAALLVLYMRAMALGFSAAMMVAAFGGRGLAYALALYGLQNLIIMPVYAYTAYFISKNRLALAVRPPDSLAATVKTAIMGLGAVIAASVIAAYVSPILFEFIWR